MVTKMNKIVKGLLNPGKAYRIIKRIIKGKWYIFWYQYVTKRATFGKHFTADGTLSIQGPGKVEFGDNVRIAMTVTPWTYSEKARIFIGDGTYLNGTRFACADEIILGNDCIMADCRIMDTDFHGTDPDNREVGRIKPILIEHNVWVTVQCVILKGSHIREGSTITPNSVVAGEIPERVIAAGNPIQVMKHV